MKKLVSIVLTIAMLASVLSVPMVAGAKSYTAIDLSSGFVADSSLSAINCKEAAVYGIAGKAADDESVMLTENSNSQTGWYEYNHGEEIYLENGEPMTGYLVAELNFMAPDANYLKEFIFGLSGNQARMTVNPTTQIAANIGKWNHLRMVYWADETNCDFKDYSDNIPTSTTDKLGATELFLNGVSLGTKQLTAVINGGGTPYSATIDRILLEVYSGDKTVQHSTYYDDIKIYKSDVNPGAPANEAVAATDKYTVSDNTITLAAGAQVTADEIAASNSGYEITAFADGTLGTQLASDANLVLGNAVVVKSPDGVYTYYTVADSATTILYSDNDGAYDSGWVLKMTQSAATGIGGKALDDESVKFVAKTKAQGYTSETNDGNIMLNKASFYTRAKKYFVIEANINPIDAENYITSVSVHTTSHAKVSDGVGLTLGQWSKYLMYVDFTGETPKAYTYVNGVLVRENDAPATFGSDKSTVRLCFNGTADTDMALYVDDFKVYETDNLPDGVTSTAKSAPASSEKYSVENGTLMVVPGTTVAELKAANTSVNVRVFTNTSCTALAADDATVDTGMAVALENSYKVISVYPAAVSYGETEIDLRTGDEGAEFPAVANGSGEAVAGFAGKDASDLVLTVIPDTDTFIPLNSWGTVVKTGSDNSVTPSWDKSDYNGYLVVEVSVFNIDNTVISLVTTQSGTASANIASAVPANEWARVKFVYNSVDGNANEGKTLAYINGKPAGDWTKALFGEMAAYTTNNYMRNDIRLSVKGGTSGQVAAYLDDIRVYEIPALRAEETVAFTAPGTSVATETEFAYIQGTTVTVGEVVNANPDITVKVFNNKTDYTEITDATAALTTGNVIVATAKSQGTIDAGHSYNDLFRVMPVAEMSGTKDVTVGVPSSAQRGTVTAVEGGIFGNASADIKKVTDNNTSDSNWYFTYDYKGISAGMNYLVYEIDFAPTADTKDLYFAANQHGHLSASVTVGGELTANQWHKLIMVYDIAADTSDLYVNGTPVSEGYKGVYSEKYAANNNTIQFRVVVDCAMGSVSYVDTYKLYESVSYPEIGAAASLADGYNADASGFVNNVAHKLSVKNGANADISISGADVTILNSNYETVGSADTLAAGDIVVIKKNGNYAYYTVALLEDNDIVVLGETYDADTGVMTPGTITAYGIAKNGGVVAVAQYGEDGGVIKLVMSQPVQEGIASVDFAAEDIDNTKIKVFLMASKASIKPLCRAEQISVTRRYNILMLGNSFSMDVTCYMEEIAEAAGKKLNIAVLNKGGSAVAYHYTNREMPLASSDIYFWLNDKGQGYSNLKTVLENYDWDYVIIQNWGSSKAFYTFSDSNYASNWAVITDLAKYINEKEPSAELMLHETWSFEAGYNDFKDASTRDEIGADIRKLYDRCAQETAAAIGYSEPLRKISSLDAFEAARAYTNADGVQLFETTYYKDGHLFSGYENRATVPVGDGTRLLSPEDATAGKVSLHRDGFHASAAARYLIALNAVEIMTGKSVYGNTYRPGEIALDSSAYYGGNEVTDLDNAKGGVIMQKYDPLSEDVVATLQTIVENMER
ncbi:MAG: DUF4886 domain-containing protein [Clostridia bacterium]|nr:DUF4886 domain-containing protein [Clostridia bacterium]